MAFFKDNKKNIYIDIMTLVLLILFSLISGILILIDYSRPSYYKLLPALPFSFVLINILAFPIFIQIRYKFAHSIIIGLYFIRNVLSPLIMRYGNYSSMFKLLNNANVNYSIITLIYETLMVYIIMIYFELNIKTLKFNKTYILKLNERKFLFKLIITFLIIICILILFIEPNVKSYYNSIFSYSNEIHNISFKLGSFSRIISTLFTVTFPIVLLIISTLLIKLIRINYNDSKKGILISFIILSIQFFTMTDETMYTFIVIMVLAGVIWKLFSKQKKFFMTIISIIFVIALFVIYKIKIENINNNSSLETLSIMFQAYFPGVSNMAGIFNIDNPNKIKTFFFDLYYMIPFRNTLFGLNGERLVTIYTNQNNAPYQILPCIGQAYHYLGFVLSPIFSCFFVYISIKTQNKLKNENNILKYVMYLLLCIYAAVTPIMYNLTIFGSRFFVTIFPLIVISNIYVEKTKNIN